MIMMDNEVVSHRGNGRDRTSSTTRRRGRKERWDGCLDILSIIII